MTAEPYTVALAQMTPRLGDVAANITRHLELVAAARKAGASLLMFPELSLTGYFLRDLTPEVALPRDADALRQLASASGELAVGVGFVEETSDHHFYNAYAYIEGGQVRHIHRKAYLPTYGMFEEERYFDAGDRFRAFPTAHGRMGILICEDVWHPSAAVILAQDRATTLLCPVASPGRGVKADHLYSAEVYELACRTYAHFLQVFCLFCNRVGYEDGVNFFGGSMVVGPDGTVLERGPLMEEALVTATVDPDVLRRTRVAASFGKDERLDITIRELRRVQDERAGD